MNERWRTLSLLTLLSALGGCSASREQDLFLGVQLVTDLEPGEEFESIEIALDDGKPQRTTAVAEGYLSPRRVAEFSKLEPSPRRRVSVRLVSTAGEEVLSRTVELEQRSSTTRTITLTRSCIGVSCKGSAASCLSGVCVDPGCMDGSEDRCGDELCSSDADCQSQSCEVASCRLGACLVRKAPHACMDAGVEDAGDASDAGKDASVVEAGVDPGPLLCDGGTCRLDAACASFSIETHRDWLCQLRQTYAAAKRFCAADGAHLAIIETESESLAIGARIAFVTQTQNIASQHFIGLDDLTVQGSYDWIDGSPLTYQNWRDGEPNNRMSAICEHEDCGTIFSSGVWNDACCASKLPFVCERDLL